MKKLFLLLGMMVLSVVVLAACGNGDDNGGNGDNGDNGAAEENGDNGDDNGDNGAEETGEQVTIRFSWWDGVPHEEITFITAFEDANPDIRVQVYSFPDGDYSQQINTMVLGGTAPDVILAWEVDLPRFAESGAIISLESLLADSDKVDLDDFIPAVAELTELTQGTYGIPWAYAGHLLYYNVDLFDAAGVDHPTEDWTWEDFAEAAEALTIPEEGQFGADAITFGGIWYSLIAAAGDNVISDDMSFDLGDGLRRALEFQYMLTDMGAIPEPSVGGDVMDLFSAGRAAMTRAGSWMYRGYQDADFNFDIVSLPSDMVESTVLHTGFFTINSQSEHQDAAWRFVEFMMSHEGQTLISEFTGNPSAIRSVAAEGAYIREGENGPTNWAAFDSIAENGRFTFTLLNPTVTSDLVGEFNSVLLGQKSIDDILDTEVPRAIDRLGEED